MKTEALLFERYPERTVRCGTCQRRCVIPPGEVGWCGTRENHDGTLYTSIYGEVSSSSVNPIEKKPVYHFLPGSRWLSLGSLGCNFRCPGCQNWEISHWLRGEMNTKYLSPEKSVATAKEHGCIGLSWTFNEPTLWFEYTVTAAQAAKQAGLYTNYVTNGSITLEALAVLQPFLDVFRVDIKAATAAAYKQIAGLDEAEGIFAVTHEAKMRGTHVEIVTNIIPGINDSDAELRGIAEWIVDTLGPDTPWHVTRFYPHLLLKDVAPTPISRLETARTIGVEMGLWYVYVGNVPGHEWENTYCHSCGALLIERHVFDVLVNRISGGECPECGERIPGVF